MDLRKLVPLTQATAALVRPTLELLSHVRHRNIASLLHLCGPSSDPREEKLGDDGFLGGRLVAWTAQRGYDFTFTQEFAQGVPINKKSMVNTTSKNTGLGDEPRFVVNHQDLSMIDLSIELGEAIAALHGSPVGTIVHGDLKVKWLLNLI
jgi:hypothetical protein